MELTRPSPDVCAALEDLGDTGRINDMADEPERTTAATLGGVLGALTLAFSAPFWRAATSYSTHPLDTVLLLLLARVLLQCHARGGRCLCVAAMFLCGLCVAESPVFLALLPVTILLVTRTVIHSDLGSEQAVPACLLAGLAGLAVNVTLGLFQFHATGAAGAEGASDAVQALGRAYLDAATGSGLADWPLVWAVPFLSLLLSIVSVQIAAFREDEVCVDGWALIVTLACVVIAQMSAAPYSSWSVARAGDSLPVIPSLMTALAAAGIFAAGYIAVAVPRHGDEYGLTAFRSHPLCAIGSVVCGALVIAALRQPCVTACDADGRRAEFADRVAQELLELFGSERIVPVRGALDLNLSMRALVLKNQLEGCTSEAASCESSERGMTTDLPARLVRFEAVCGPLLESDPLSPPWLMRTRVELRRHVCGNIRELGKICDETGCADAAAAAYGLASRIQTKREGKGEM